MTKRDAETPRSGIALDGGPTLEAARESASQFWEQQDKLLDSMQEFAQGWFSRRHTGARAALQASQRLCQAKDPAEAFAEYQSWAKGALERTVADATALQQQAMRLASAAREAAPHD